MHTKQGENNHHCICPRLVNTGRQHTQINIPFQGLKFHSRSLFDPLIQLLWFIIGDKRSREKHGFHPSCDQWVTEEEYPE